VITRTENHDLVASTFDPALTSGGPPLAVPGTASEHLLAALRLSDRTWALTDERLVDLASGASFTWAAVLGADPADGFKNGRIYGTATRGDQLLIAWGAQDVLRLAVVDAAGHLVAQATDEHFLRYLGTATTTAIPYGDGLLMFDGNPVRVSRIGFDLKVEALGMNQQLRVFYRTVARVAAVSSRDRPVGFWLTVYPGTDDKQGSYSHQLYGCALDPATPETCARTFPVASPAFLGYGVADEPVAATALASNDGFAVVHTDAAGRSWLRIGDFTCGGTGP
jgi:hypothetical protein